MEKVKIDDVLKYEQPTKYIVETENYDDSYNTPVLTAGKSFLLGYTNEEKGVFNEVPVIIFDDFTTSFHFVDFPFKVKSSALKILKAVKDKADIKYLYYKMQTIKFEAEQHKRYWISKYSQIEIPLPSIATQQRIAAILDQADAIIQNNRAIVQKYDALTQSLFLDMFGDPVKNEKGWEVVQVENVASNEKHSIKAGPFGSSLKKEFYVEKGYKIYGQEQVIKDDMSYGDYYIDEKKYKELESCRVKEGDILISLVGTYGKVSIIPDNFEEGIINPRLMKISPNKNIIRPDFLKFLLQSSYVEKQLKNHSRGGTMDIINVGIIRKLFIPLPSLEMQNQFAERVAVIEAQKQQAQLELAKSEELFQSLLQRAFKGG